MLSTCPSLSVSLPRDQPVRYLAFSFSSLSGTFVSRNCLSWKHLVFTKLRFGEVAQVGRIRQEMPTEVHEFAGYIFDYEDTQRVRPECLLERTE